MPQPEDSTAAAVVDQRHLMWQLAREAAVAPDIDGAGPLRAARRVFLRHTRRKYPDTGRCGFCGGTWLAKEPQSRMIDGCAARQYAARHLAEAGHLDQDGHLVTFPLGGAEQSGS